MLALAPLREGGTEVNRAFLSPPPSLASAMAKSSWHLHAAAAERPGEGMGEGSPPNLLGLV